MESSSSIDLAGERVDRAHALDLVAEELDAHRPLLVGREHLDRVAAHAELVAGEARSRCARTAARRAGAGSTRWSRSSPLLEHQQLLGVHLGRAEPVDRRDRRDDDHVAAGQQRARGRVAQPVDLVVDRAVLLDVRVGRRDVRLGLVVVVVGDEVLDPVLREELPELGRELRGQRLVGREHERRPLRLRDHVGDREALARAGDAEQRLELVAPLDAVDERRDRLRLVAGRRHVGDELEFRHASSVPTGCDSYGRSSTSPVSASGCVRRSSARSGLGGLAGRARRARARCASIWRSRWARSPRVVDHPGRDRAPLLVGRLERHAPLGVVARHAARLEPLQPHLPRRLHHDHRAVVVRRASTRRAAARRARRSASAGAAATWRRNSSPIAGCVIASSCLRRLVGHERPLGERGAVERPVGRAGSRARTPRRAPRAPACPGSTTSRAIASASTTTAPRSASMPRHRRLAGPDPAREPDHEHDRRVYEPLRATAPWSRPARSAAAQDTLPPADKAREARRERPATIAGGSSPWPDANRPKGSAASRPRWPSSDEAAPRIESRLVRLTVTTRWVTIVAGIIFGVARATRASTSSLAPIALVVFAGDPDLPPAAAEPADRASGCSSSLELAAHRRRHAPSPAASRARSCSRRSPGCCSPATCGAGGPRSAPRSPASIAAAPTIAMQIDRRHRPARGRPDRGRVPAVRRARRVHPQPDRRDREPPGGRDRPGRRDGDRQRAARLAARARADAAGVVRPARGRRLDAPPAALARPLQRARRARPRRRRSRCGPSSSPKACGSRPA